MRRFFALLPLTFLLASPLLHAPVARAQDSKPDKPAALDIKQTFAAGNTLLQERKYAEALLEYQKILAVDPDLEGPLRNGGMAAYFAGDYKTSLAYYTKLKAAFPDDGFIRSRLVQVYQAMGDTASRDKERADLVALHLSGKDTSSLAKRGEFCWDQYRLGDRLILVYVPYVFAPRSTKSNLFAVRYQFIVANAKGEMEMRIEAGWDNVEKDANGNYQPTKELDSFYFDAYYPDSPGASHTKGLFMKELSYADCKAHVQAIVEGKVKSSGGFKPGNTPAPPKLPAKP